MDEHKPEGRKPLNLRVHPEVHAALSRWAGDELRSANAQAEKILRDALIAAGRLGSDPGRLGPVERPRGRPPRPADTDTPDAHGHS